MTTTTKGKRGALTVPPVIQEPSQDVCEVLDTLAKLSAGTVAPISFIADLAAVGEPAIRARIRAGELEAPLSLSVGNHLLRCIDVQPAIDLYHPHGLPPKLQEVLDFFERFSIYVAANNGNLYRVLGASINEWPEQLTRS